MKKRALIVFMLLCLGDSLYAKEKIPVAVLDLVPNGVPDFYGRAVADMMLTEIRRYDDFQLIERGQVEIILKEQETQKKCSSSDCAVQMGKLLSARKIVIGSVTKMGRLYTVSGKVVDVEKGSVETAELESCTEEEDLEAVSRVLAVRLVNSIAAKEYPLPERTYLSDVKRNRFAVYLGVRGGFMPGLNYYSAHGVWPDYTISEKKRNAYAVHGIIRPSYEINRYFTIMADVRYIHLETIMYDKDSTSEIHDSMESTREFNGFGVFAGMKAHYQVSGFMPYVSAAIGYNRIYFPHDAAYRVEFNSSGNNSCHDVVIDNVNNYCSTEFELGCSVFMSRFVELVLGLGVEVPVGTDLFKNSKIRYDETYSSGTPANVRNSYNGSFPPIYYAQFGFNLRLF